MILGIDLGATNYTVALEDAGTTIANRVDQTPATTGDAVIDAVCSTVETLCESRAVAPTTVEGVGVGTIGPLADGAVVDPPNLPGITQIPIEEPLQELTEAPVSMRNDAIAGLIGEREAGAPPNAVYLTMSSGIGAGACVDGHILTGATGNAAEVGHFVVDPDDDLECGCGATGHWEAYCGGESIPRHATHHHRTTDTNTSLPVASTELDAKTVLQATDTDELAAAVKAAIAKYNAVGIAALVHAYDPTTVIVGGAVARNHPDTVIAPACNQLAEYVVRDPPTVELTTLSNPVLAGALALGRDAGRP